MESFNLEMMLFQPPVVNHGIEYLQWIECRPVIQITEDGSIDIHLKASGSQYLDLQRSRLYVKAKIVNENGDALEMTDIDPCQSVVAVSTESSGCIFPAKAR